MFKNLISATMIALITTTTVASASATGSVSIPEEKVETDSDAALVGSVVGGTLAAGAAGTAAALSAAGLVAVPHAAGGMILLSTGTGASYIAGTLGVIGGAAACVASVVCAVAVAGGAAVAAGTGYYVVEKIKSKPIEFDDVMTGKKIWLAGNSYYSIKKKYLKSESRDQLWDLGTEFETSSEVGLRHNNILVAFGILRDTYYVDKDTYDTLKKEFEEGGLYEAKD